MAVSIPDQDLRAGHHGPNAHQAQDSHHRVCLGPRHELHSGVEAEVGADRVQQVVHRGDDRQSYEHEGSGCHQCAVDLRARNRHAFRLLTRGTSGASNANPTNATPNSGMKALMSADPLTYGVDAIRNVMFSGTAIVVGGTTRSLVDIARGTGLIRWSLPARASSTTRHSNSP